MIDEDAIKEILANSEYSKRDKVLACLALMPDEPQSVAAIRNRAVNFGLPSIKKWNISSILLNCKENTIRTPKGWELTKAGKEFIRSRFSDVLPSVSLLVVSGLRNQLSTIKKKSTRKFIEEAIRGLEAKLYRSAVVISWVGAIAVLYDLVLELYLNDFNKEVSKRDPKWRAAKSADDLGRLKEYDFLQILWSLSILGKNVKDELEVCLKLRNGCGHPNSLVVGEHKAAAHVETLIQNVFAKF